MHVMRAVAIANFRITCNSDNTTNGHIDVVQELLGTSVFQSFSQLYQYFKVSFVEIIITPSPVQGTLPPVGYSLLKGNEELSFTYNELAENPCCRRIRNNKVTYMKFTRAGRNPDFNYWYNSNKNAMPPEAAATVIYRFSQPLTEVEGTGYYFRVKWHLKFSNYFISTANKALGIEENEIINDKDLANLNEKVTVETDEIKAEPDPHA